jgi:DNA-binding MarR family transcriptional regulator
MGTDQVATLRSFNRTVTERVGALHDEFLGRGRPLGASRVLWEIGSNGSDVRSLRVGLGFDSGYLSRLLRRLEREGLVEVVPSEADGRVREVQLTADGVTELETLDRLADELAESLLAPLQEPHRSRLVEAMATVERLLTAGLVELVIEDPAGEAARFCVGQYFSELVTRFETGFDSRRSTPTEANELVEPNGVFLVAWLRGRPIGCGCLKLHADQPAEVKRMWVTPDARGLGLGRRILGELERYGSDRGVTAFRLETNGALVEAIGLYRSMGYVEVAPFNDERYAHHWFEKRL